MVRPADALDPETLELAAFLGCEPHGLAEWLEEGLDEAPPLAAEAIALLKENGYGRRPSPIPAATGS